MSTPTLEVPHVAGLSSQEPMNAFKLADLPNLIERQIQVMEDITDVLRKLENGQTAATAQSIQAIRDVPADSSSAWSPLLRSHLNNIQPTVDRWRGTLDTMLVFVALFSAVVTAFFVQSLSGLSEDTGKRTNELLANLTDLIIILSSTNSSALNLTPAIPFEPGASATRHTFYWSISLILSLSVASLAVTSRGYVVMITRSRYTHANENLTDLYPRWKQTEKLLGPVVEALPQLLIPSVVLFITGLIDTLFSISSPFSHPFVLVRVAATISCFFVMAVGVYVLYTVVHGSIDRPCSPFQSLLSYWIWSGTHGPRRDGRWSLATIYRQFLSSFTIYYNHPPDPEAAPETPRPTRNLAKDSSQLAIPHEATNTFQLTADHHAVFHSMIHTTYDDHVLDQAVAAVGSLIKLRQTDEDIQQIQLGFWTVVPVTECEMKTFQYLLSSGVSFRVNLAIATCISASLTRRNEFVDQNNTLVKVACYQYESKDRIILIDLLRLAINRQDGWKPLSLMWSSPFTVAMAKLLSCSIFHPRALVCGWWEELSQHAPVLCLLLTSTSNTGWDCDNKPKMEHVYPQVQSYAYKVLLSKLMELHPALEFGSHAMEIYPAMEKLMLSQSPKILHHILQVQLAEKPTDHAPLLLHIHTPSIFSEYNHLHAALAHWIINPPGPVLAIEDIVSGVTQVVIFIESYHNLVAINPYDWIIFLCEELLKAVCSNYASDKEQPPDLRQPLLELCAKLMLLASDHDREKPRWSYYFHRDHNEPASRLTRCTLSCSFTLIVSRLLLDVPYSNSEYAVLDADTWKRISQAFNPEDKEHNIDRTGSTCSTAQHRNKVKQTIYDMFQLFAPVQ